MNGREENVQGVNIVRSLAEEVEQAVIDEEKLGAYFDGVNETFFGEFVDSYVQKSIEFEQMTDWLCTM